MIVKSHFSVDHMTTDSKNVFGWSGTTDTFYESIPDTDIPGPIVTGKYG